MPGCAPAPRQETGIALVKAVLGDVNRAASKRGVFAHISDEDVLATGVSPSGRPDRAVRLTHPAPLKLDR